MRHVDDGELHAYLDGARAGLAGVEMDRIRDHLESCQLCTERLETERVAVQLSHSILRGDDSVMPTLPSYEEAVLGRRPSITPKRKRTAAIPFAWAASLVVAIAAGWVARESVRAPSAVVFAPAPESSAADRVESPLAMPPVPLEPDQTAMHSASEPAPATASPPRRPEGLPPSEEGEARADAGGRMLDVDGVREPVTATELARATSKTDSAASESPEPSEPLRIADVAFHATATARSTGAASGPPARTRVHGRVTDPAGLPLPGVHVMAPTLSVGTITDSDGRYSFTLPPGASQSADTLIIVAQAIGRERVARPLSHPADMADPQDFRLRRSVLSLEGLVVTGIVSAPDPVPWQPVELASAEAAVERRLPIVAGLPVLAIELRTTEDGDVVRVRQQLELGEVIELEYEPDRTIRQPPLARTGHDTVTVLEAVHGRDGAELRIHAGGLRIIARAPISVEELLKLVERLDHGLEW